MTAPASCGRVCGSVLLHVQLLALLLLCGCVPVCVCPSVSSTSGDASVDGDDAGGAP